MVPAFQTVQYDSVHECTTAQIYHLVNLWWVKLLAILLFTVVKSAEWWTTEDKTKFDYQDKQLTNNNEVAVATILFVLPL